MKVFAKVLALCFLILLAAIVGGRAKTQQPETPRPVKALYKQVLGLENLYLQCSRNQR